MDIFIPFDIEAISQFTSFVGFDFTTFTDFQKVVVILGVSILWLVFLYLMCYLIIFTIHKIISFVKLIF